MSRRVRVLRGFGLLLALALGAGGAWLVVTADTVRWVRLGTLAGLWGLLIGTFAMFGGRTVATTAAPPVATPGGPSAAPDDAVRERRFDSRLEDILRREVRSTITRELDALRSELKSAAELKSPAEPASTAESNGVADSSTNGQRGRRRQGRHAQ